MGVSARRFIVALLLGALALVAVIVLRLGSGLLIAAVGAVILSPVQERLSRRLKGRKALSAALLVFAVVALVLTPVITLSAVLVRELIEGARFVGRIIESNGVVGLVERLPAPLEHAAMALLKRLPSDPGAPLEEAITELTKQGGAAAAAVGGALAATGSVLFQAVVMVVALFVFLANADECVEWLNAASPLSAAQTREVLTELKKTSYSVFVGSTATGAVQTALAIVGYLIARVPNVVFFGALTFTLSLVPGVGAGGVVFLTAAVMFFSGHQWLALFLVAWGVFVGLIDNVIRPLFMKKGQASSSGAVALFSLVGGVAAFGPIGLIVGPLAVTLFLALLRIYRRDVEGKSAAPPPPRPAPSQPS
jgi:predicted PurR-regulated permease PerM